VTLTFITPVAHRGKGNLKEIESGEGQAMRPAVDPLGCSTYSVAGNWPSARRARSIGEKRTAPSAQSGNNLGTYSVWLTGALDTGTDLPSGERVHFLNQLIM
jgi:hypothetical protein